MQDIGVKIQAALDEFWDERALPIDSGAATTVDDLVGPIESMTAVEVLVVLDDIVGMKLPNTVIQAGGYQSKQEFIEKLTAQVLEQIKPKA